MPIIQVAKESRDHATPTLVRSRYEIEIGGHRIRQSQSTSVGISIRVPTEVINPVEGKSTVTKIQVYKDVAGYFRWRLVAANGEKVAASEAYYSKEGAVNSAEKVKYWASVAQIVSLV